MAKVIPLQSLADQLGVPVKRLLPALEHGYIRLITSDPPVVYEPPPAAIQWLKGMFQPLALRPFLGIDMVADLENLKPSEVRTLCLGYDIPIQLDAVFGEVLSITSFYKFHVSLHHYREPSRFDRQAMLVALLQAGDPERYKGDLKPPTYSKRLEAEIRRIAKLEEPMRTEMALRLVEAFESAKTITDILAKLRGKEPATLKAMEKAEKMVAVSPLQESHGRDPQQ